MREAEAGSELSPEGLGETGQGSLELAPLAGSLGEPVPLDGFSMVLTKYMKGTVPLAEPVLFWKLEKNHPR